MTMTHTKRLGLVKQRKDMIYGQVTKHWLGVHAGLCAGKIEPIISVETSVIWP